MVTTRSSMSWSTTLSISTEENRTSNPNESSKCFCTRFQSAVTRTVKAGRRAKKSRAYTTPTGRIWPCSSDASINSTPD